MSKIISLILAAGLCVFLLTGTPAQTYKQEAAEIQNPYSLSIEEQSGAVRDSLAEPLKQLYDLVKGSVLSMDKEIEVKRLAYDEHDLWTVVLCIMYDSPQIFWVDWSNWQVRSGNNGFVLTPTYLIEAESLETKIAELNGAVDAFVSSVTAAGLTAASDYEKVLFAHDYLVNNVAYDSEYLSYPTGSMMDLHTSYGALVGRKAVCDGYAHAFAMLLNAVSVESRYVEGYTLDSGEDEGHAWNIVKIMNAWYHVDVTWDDFDSEQDDRAMGGLVSHVYFLLSDSEIAVDHTSETRAELPVCPEGYNYFGKLGLAGPDLDSISSSVTESAVKSIVNGCYIVEFMITDPSGEFALGGILTDVNEWLRGAGQSQRVDETTYQLVPNDERQSFSFIMFKPE